MASYFDRKKELVPRFDTLFNEISIRVKFGDSEAERILDERRCRVYEKELNRLWPNRYKFPGNLAMSVLKKDLKRFASIPYHLLPKSDGIRYMLFFLKRRSYFNPTLIDAAKKRKRYYEEYDEEEKDNKEKNDNDYNNDDDYENEINKNDSEEKKEKENELYNKNYDETYETLLYSRSGDFYKIQCPYIGTAIYINNEQDQLNDNDKKIKCDEKKENSERDENIVFFTDNEEEDDNDDENENDDEQKNKENEIQKQNIDNDKTDKNKTGIGNDKKEKEKTKKKYVEMTNTEIYNGSLFDAELVKTNDGKHVLQVFDCLIFCGKLIINKPFEYRLEQAMKVFNNENLQFIYHYNEFDDTFKIEVKKLISFDEARDIFSQKKNDLFNYPIDGIIAVKSNSQYICGRDSTEFSILKYKLFENHTLDFFVQVNERTGELFFEILDTKRGNMKNNYILVFKRPISKNILKKLKIPHALLLNNTIVECSWNRKKCIWEPLKIRYDKEFPNNRITLEATMNNNNESNLITPEQFISAVKLGWENSKK